MNSDTSPRCGIFVGISLLCAATTAWAQSAPKPPSAQVTDSAQRAFFAVLAGASRSSGKVTVKVSGRDTDGAFAIVEVPTTAGYGPPLHRHHVENEWFYALDGEYDVQVADSVWHLTPGGSVFGPRMIPHTWRNVGKKPGRLLVLAQPAGHIEAFLEGLANLGPPSTRDPAAYRAVFAKFEMDVVGPPLWERRDSVAHH
jgi:mannose-6-phosphate isomerase-like protein (cupin superfamily)